jgi:hypothetical protein
MAPKPPSGPFLPEVTAADVSDNFNWFSARSGRRYRARQGAGGMWIVRRRGDVFLRTWSDAKELRTLPDRDDDLRPAWFFAAWPTLDPKERKELIRAARKAKT